MNAEQHEQTARLERGLARFRRSARRAERRHRLGDVLGAVARLTPVVLLLLAPPLALARLRPGHGYERWLYAVAAVGVLALVGRALWVGLRRAAPLAGALELDRFHATGGRIANAIAFSRLPAAERTPLMQLAIEDALAVVSRLEPQKAVRVPVPREAPLVVLIVVGLVVLSRLHVREVAPVVPKPVVPPALMNADDLAYFRAEADDLSRAPHDQAQEAAIARYNKLIEDIAGHRVDEHEVFRRLSQIEADLGEHLEADQAALHEGLEGLARELGKSGLTRKTAEALDDKRLDDAEKALRELSKRLKEERHAPSAAELERLRSALEHASQATHERLAAIERRRAELAEERKSLLKKKGDPAQKKDAEQKLADNQRQLEHLDRESSRAKRAAQQFSELDRELAKAAQDLEQALRERQKNAGEQAAEDLNRSAEQMHQMARQQLNDAQKRELLQRLKEMREVLRQQGQGGKLRQKRMQRFAERARGEKPGEGEGQQGKIGKGNLELRFGRGGMELPGVPGSTPSESSGQQGKEGENGSGPPKAGQGAGTGHDDKIAGAATHLKGQTHDVTAAGMDSGEGTASAEVIYGAAQRGFVGKSYKDIFTEYHSVAEQVIDKDEIPPGYRFYVRRYFQLIRPRE